MMPEYTNKDIEGVRNLEELMEIHNVNEANPML